MFAGRIDRGKDQEFAGAEWAMLIESGEQMQIGELV